MFWTKPKRFIKKIINILSVVSAVLSLVLLATVYMWVYQQNVVNELDDYITGYYISSFERSFDNAIELKNAGRSKESLDEFNNLFRRVKYFGKSDRLYQLKRKVMINVIQLEMLLNDFENAKEIAKFWMNSDGRDIDAKMAYIDILIATNDWNLAESELSILFKKFNNVRVIKDKYIDVLVSQNKYKEAIQIRNESLKTQNWMDPVKFKIFYTETDSEKISDTKSIRINRYRSERNNLSVTQNMKIIGLHKLRFDVDYLDDFKMSDIDISLTVESGKTYKAEIEAGSLFNLLKIDGKYLSNGNDPHFNIKVPEVFNDYKGVVSIRIAFKLEEGTAKNILQSCINSRNEYIILHSWIRPVKFKIFYAESASELLTEKKAIRITNFDLNKNLLTIEQSIKIRGLSKLRFDIDYLDNFVLSNVEIFFILSNDIKYKTNVVENSLFDLKIVNRDYYSVGNDPHFEIVVPNKLNNYDGLLNIRISFNVMQDKSNHSSGNIQCNENIVNWK